MNREGGPADAVAHSRYRSRDRVPYVTRKRSRAVDEARTGSKREDDGRSRHWIGGGVSHAHREAQITSRTTDERRNRGSGRTRYAGERTRRNQENEAVSGDDQCVTHGALLERWGTATRSGVNGGGMIGLLPRLERQRTREQPPILDPDGRPTARAWGG